MDASERKNGYLGQVRMSESRPQPQGTNRKVCDAAGAEEAKAASIGKRKRRLCEELETISGGNGERVPPVPIPNTEVKPFSADGTWLDTARESRSPPDSIQRMFQANILFLCREKQGYDDCRWISVPLGSANFLANFVDQPRESCCGAAHFRV